MIGFGVAGSTLILFQVKEGVKSIISEKDLASHESVYLKAEAINGRFFRFYWSTGQKEWNAFNEDDSFIDGTYLPRWGVAMRVGLMVENKTDHTGIFSYFELSHKF